MKVPLPPRSRASSASSKAGTLSKPAGVSTLPAAAGTVTHEGGQKPAKQLKEQDPSQSDESSDDEEMKSGKIHIKTAATISFKFFSFVIFGSRSVVFQFVWLDPDHCKNQQTDPPQSLNMVCACGGGGFFI